MFKLSMFLHFKLTLVPCLDFSAEGSLSKNQKLQNDFRLIYLYIYDIKFICMQGNAINE